MRRVVVIFTIAMLSVLLLASMQPCVQGFVWRRKPKPKNIFPRPENFCEFLKQMKAAEGMNGTFYAYHWINVSSTGSCEYSWTWTGGTCEGDIEVSRDIHAFVVSVLYDPDDSVGAFIRGEADHPRFTGDEVLTHNVAVVAEVDGTISYTKNGQSGEEDFQFVRAFFMIEQIHLRKAKIEDGKIAEASGDFMRHRLIGVHAFRDENENGVMDYEWQEGELVGEAVYRFRARHVDSVKAKLPEVKDGNLTWGIDIKGVEGEFVPVEVPEYAPESVLSEPAEQASVEEFEYTFRFSPSVRELGGKTYRVAEVKVDTFVGDWDSSVELSDLSLALTYLTIEGSFNRVVTHRALDSQGKQCPGDSPHSVTTTSLEFYAGSEAVGEVIFGGNTYVWNQTEEVQATSCTTPLGLLFLEYGGVLPCVTWHVEINATTHLYSACYPKWGGFSINHDPYFVMVSSPVAIVATPQLPSILKNPLILGGLMAVAVVVSGIYLSRRRREYTE